MAVLWNAFWTQLGQLILENWSALVVDVVLTVVLLQPLFNFLSYGWVRKAEEIDNSLVSEAKQTYLKVFWNRDVALNQVEKDFSDLYQRWYGRRRYFSPIAILLVIAGFENFYLGREIIQLTNGGDLHTAMSAIAGAYTFVTWDFFGRVQRRNLLTTDILRGALRLIIAMPVGFAFAALLDKGFGPFLAFAVGVFPLETISTILRRLVYDKLKLEPDADKTSDPIGMLSGIDRSIVDRIQDADITTIPQLAWCDPIQLTMRSSLSFDYVVDIVSQALAWVYLGDKLTVLRTLGLRGAYEMRVLADDLASKNPATKKKAAAVLPIAADKAGIPLDGFVYALEQIAEDGATKFLWDAG